MILMIVIFSSWKPQVKNLKLIEELILSFSKLLLQQYKYLQYMQPQSCWTGSHTEDEHWHPPEGS